MKNGIGICRGDTVFDIGANIGLFSMFINASVDGLNIHAFEPVPMIYEALEKNLKEFGNISMNNVGLGEKEEEIDFFFYPNNSGNSSAVLLDFDYRLKKTLENYDKIADHANPRYKLIPHFLRKPMLLSLKKKLYTPEHVRCKIIPLSKYLTENKIDKIDLMKIDAENAEKQVLKGLTNEDWGKIKQIAMEVHTNYAGGYDNLDVMKSLLEGKGFTTSVGDESPDTLIGVYMLYGIRKG